MHVETYEKVHHLVSTIRGTLHPHVNSVEALQKCFPPGSMTGAPKLRSVQILDQLEQHKPRGVYSGCLGYFSLNGSADFNVVIRTAVASTKADGTVEISVGGGGAITFLSDPEQEWKETLLKTKSVAPRYVTSRGFIHASDFINMTLQLLALKSFLKINNFIMYTLYL